MKTSVQKLMSVVVIVGLITSQIGCAGKTIQMSEKLDEVQFGKNIDYSIRLKNGKRLLNIPGDRIQASKSKLEVSGSKEKKSILAQDISQIEWKSPTSEGTNALRGMVLGALVVGIMGMTYGSAVSDIGGDGNGTNANFILVGLGLGAAVGGLLGLGIGALIPRHHKIQITPIIEPTTSGINAGANVGVTF